MRFDARRALRGRSDSRRGRHRHHRHPIGKSRQRVLPVKEPHNSYNTGRNDVLWVSSMGDHEINRIDLKKMEYTDKIPVGGIPRPYAVTKDEKTLYVALSDYHGFEIVNIADKKEIARVDLPAAPLRGLRARTAYGDARPCALSQRKGTLGHEPFRQRRLRL